MPRPHLLVFDVESTGGDVLTHSIVAVGAALIDVAANRCVWAEQRVVRRSLLTAWEPRCEREFWSQPQPQALLRLTEGADALLSYSALAAWVSDAIRWAHDAASGALELATDNPVFDGTFLDVLLTGHGAPPLKYTVPGRYLSVLDTDSFEAGAKAALQAQAGAAQAEAPMTLQFDAPPHDHMPAHDAAHIGLRHVALLRQLAARTL